MYKINGTIEDTPGIEESVSALKDLFEFAYKCGYFWVSGPMIEQHLQDHRMTQHRGYILRLLQDRNYVIGVTANRDIDGKLVQLWRLRGKACPQYNSRQIPSDHVLD